MTQERLYALCESLIELVLCRAFFANWRDAEPAFGLCTPQRMRDAEIAGKRLVFAQYPIEKFRADFLLVQASSAPLVVECDGHAYHQGDPSTWERDLERDQAIRRCGFQTVHFGGWQIKNRTMDVLRTIERALAGEFSA